MNDILISYPLNDYRNYLQHHGVKGQKWGQRNAEWYPIAAYKAHLARNGGSSKGGNSARNSARIRTTQGGAAYDAFKRRMERLKVEEAEELVKKAKTSHEKEKYEKELKELLKKVNDKKKGRELTAKEWNLVRKQDPDVKLSEQKRALADVEKERRERRQYLEENKETIMQKGTMEEILELAGIADNSRLAQAINNRHTLDQVLNSVETKRKWEKFQPLLDNAQRAAEVAGTISNLVNKSYGAYKDVNTALKGLGIISDKKPKEENKLAGLLKGKNATEISNNVYQAAINGKISAKELNEAKSILNNLFAVEKSAGKDKESLRKEEETRNKMFEKSKKLRESMKELDDKVKAQKEEKRFANDQKSSDLSMKDAEKDRERVTANRAKEEKERRDAISKSLDALLGEMNANKKSIKDKLIATENSTNKSEDQSSSPKKKVYNPVTEEVFNAVVQKYGRKKYESPQSTFRQYMTDELTKIFDSSQQYKNSEHVRDIARKVREDGYSSLSPSEKETYKKFYLK